MKASARVVLMTISLTSLMLSWTMPAAAQERTVFIAEGRIGNAVFQSNVWQAGDFEYDLSTNTAAPAAQAHYPWPNGGTVPFEVRYDAVSGRAQMRVGSGENLSWEVPGVPLTSNGVVNLRLGGRGGSVAPGELRLSDLEWETNGFVAVAGGGYQTGLISGLPAAAQWRLWGQVRMTWPDGALPAHSQLAFQLAFTEPPQVVSVQWEQHVKPLTDNPAAQGGGLRMFAERDDAAAQPSVDNQTVTVKATVVPRQAGVRVYFASFDVDDPTANTEPVDAMDEEFPDRGNDNRGTPNNGTFLNGVSFADTDANGEARVQLVVTTQPGDNFRVAATLDENEFQRLGIYANEPDSIYVPANSEPVLAGFAGRVSPLLTVWRSVYVEVDAMEPMPEYPNPESNFVGGFLSADSNGYLINGIAGVADTVFLDRSLVELSPTDRDLSPNLDTLENYGKGRFENGWLWIGSDVTAEIFGNGEFHVRKRTIDGGLSIPFVIKKAGRPDITGNVCDCEMNGSNSLPLRGALDNGYKGGSLSVAGETMHIEKVVKAGNAVQVLERKPVVFWLHDDDDDSILNQQNGQRATAFSGHQPVGRGASTCFYGADSPKPTVPFLRNYRTIADFDRMAVNEFDMKDLNASDYWVTRMVSAYQAAAWGKFDDGQVLMDADPASEGALLGICDLGASLKAPSATVYLETTRDALGLDREGLVVVHELGHGLAGSSTHPVTTCDDAACPAADPVVFTPSYLDRIRQSPQPGKLE